MRARGLKHGEGLELLEEGGSRPVRARGLKQPPVPRAINTLFVAPRAGAWIETLYNHLLLITLLGRAPCGRVD